MTEKPIEDRRQGERRADWHTPNDCFKLLDVQTAMDAIYKQLAAGDKRMSCIESKLEANHKVATDGLNKLSSSQDEYSRDISEVLEIVRMGKGFFKTVFVAGKWVRKSVMWIVPPLTALLSLWYMLTDKR